MHHLRLLCIVAFTWCLWPPTTASCQLQGTLRLELPENQFRSCSFSPDGSLLVTGGNAIRVYHWDSQRLIQIFHPTPQPRRIEPVPVPVEHFGAYLKYLGGFPKLSDHIAFAPTRRDLFASSDADGSIRVWRLGSDKPHKEFRAIGGATGRHVRHLSFTPDSRYLVSLGDRWNNRGQVIGDIRIWNMENGELEYSDLFYEENAAACGISEDSQFLALSRDAQGKGRNSKIEIYRIGDWNLMRTIELLNGAGQSILFSAKDSRLIVTGVERFPVQGGFKMTGRIWIANQDANAPIAPIKDATGHSFNCAQLTSDGKFFVRTSSQIGNAIVDQFQLRDSQSGTSILTLDCELRAFQGLAIHPNQKVVVMCDTTAMYLLPLEKDAKATRLKLEF